MEPAWGDRPRRWRSSPRFRVVENERVLRGVVRVPRTFPALLRETFLTFSLTLRGLTVRFDRCCQHGQAHETGAFAGLPSTT